MGNENRYPPGYIPLTIHELCERDSRSNGKGRGERVSYADLSDDAQDIPSFRTHSNNGNGRGGHKQNRSRHNNNNNRQQGNGNGRRDFRHRDDNRPRREGEAVGEGSAERVEAAATPAADDSAE